MESVTKLIAAFAQILWPILGFTTLIMFRKEIAEILRRIKKGKMLGQEIELSDSLEELRASAETVKEAASTIPTPDPEPTTEILEKTEHDEIKQILDEAIKSPRVALITLGGYIEIAARRALASSGLMRSVHTFSTADIFTQLSTQYWGLPQNILDSMKLFMDMRNKLVHMKEATEDDIISALDSGITILRTIKALPVSTTTVLEVNIPIYSDKDCKQLAHGSGILLESVSPGGIKKNINLFPTQREWFEKGQIVSWDWNTSNVWGETWYVDPETKEIKKGWHSSGEFIGRSLDTI